MGFAGATILAVTDGPEIRRWIDYLWFVGVDQTSDTETKRPRLHARARPDSGAHHCVILIIATPWLGTFIAV